MLGQLLHNDFIHLPDLLWREQRCCNITTAMHMLVALCLSPFKLPCTALNVHPQPTQTIPPLPLPPLLLCLCCCCRLLQDFPWLTAARASSLAAGCAGVLAVMRCLGAQSVLVSDADLLDGVMLRLQQDQHVAGTAQASSSLL